MIFINQTYFCCLLSHMINSLVYLDIFNFFVGCASLPHPFLLSIKIWFTITIIFLFLVLFFIAFHSFMLYFYYKIISTIHAINYWEEPASNSFNQLPILISVCLLTSASLPNMNYLFIIKLNNHIIMSSN